jgi:hypothetical protein
MLAPFTFHGELLSQSAALRAKTRLKFAQVWSDIYIYIIFYANFPLSLVEVHLTQM